MNNTDDANRQPDTPDIDSELFVVGLGASAGGLEAFERFFTHMPIDANMAFVLIQHLDAEHVSILPELIARFTRMPVLQVTDNLPVKPNHVYVIPANHNLALQQGKLILSKLEPNRGNRLPIDFFFNSLASEQGERAIGIVLSGTGSDGSQGIEAIRSAGGIVIAQSPESAAYDGMPRSALATGMVDATLPPESMPAELLRYWQTREPLSTLLANHDNSEFIDPLKKIFSLLYGLTRQDFSFYKQSTILRQIERRMKVNFLNNLNQYVHYLQEKPEELQLLFSDLLIGVTRFFRDPEAFQHLSKQAILPIIHKDPESEIPIRVWVPACSTGEEAYSIAIVFQEQLEDLRCHRKVQIYATDIDPQAINQARAGIYRSQIQSDLTEERLQRFFTLNGSMVQVKKSIRDMVVFAEQNLIMDPPFSRLDLISCRNLLIYLEPETQRRIFPLFHYALNPDGFLFLGNAETTGGFGDFFRTLDRRNKIYRKKETAQAGIGEVKFRVPPGKHAPPSHLSIEKEEIRLGLREWTENALLNFFSPACVVTDEKFNVLYVQGHTSDYLESPTGEMTNNVVKMAREGLKVKLSAALRKAMSQNTQVQLSPLKYSSHQSDHAIRLTVKPFFGAVGGQTLILIVFEDLRLESKEKTALPSASSAPNKDLRIAELEQDLRLKEDYILSTIDDLETANQDIKLVNQDLMSANEELQSTNEELETSKEELQSINEELATVNTELQRKNEELSTTVNDLNNFLTSTEIATIFLDLDLQIRRFTPTINKIFNLLPGDIGRPIQHFVSNLAYDKMIADCQAVLDTLYSRSVEVQSHKGAWYLMTIKPYRTVEHMIDGLVITFFDITEQKESEEARRLSVLLRDSNDAIVVFDFQGNIISWNQGATHLYGWSESEGLRMNIQGIIPPEKSEEMRAIIQQIAAGQKIDSFETERLSRDSQRRLVWATMTGLFNELGEPIRIATTERDIAVRKQEEQSLRFENRALTSLQHWYRALFVRTSPEADLAKLCQILVEDAGYRLAWFGQVRANGKPKVKPMIGAGLGQADLDELEFSRQTAKTSQTLIETAIRTGQPAVARNIFTDAQHKRWRAEAAKLGYASFVLIPVPGKEPESSSGILMIYAAEADAFITEEMELLKQLFSDLPQPNLGLENKKGR
jgi:two-component system, chemotaxis family, CheB/CheR fusion protein